MLTRLAAITVAGAVLLLQCIASEDTDEEITGRKSSSSGSSPLGSLTAGNVTVSFVPLISLFASTWPNILSQFQSLTGLSTGTATTPDGSSIGIGNVNFDTVLNLLGLGSARDFDDTSTTEGPATNVDSGFGYVGSRGRFCTVGRIGQWRDVADCTKFYKCSVSENAPESCTKLYHLDKTKVRNKPRELEQIDQDHHPSARYTRDASNKYEDLESESFSGTCVTMTVYSCPDDDIYSPSQKSCVLYNEQLVSKLCISDAD